MSDDSQLKSSSQVVDPPGAELAVGQLSCASPAPGFGKVFNVQSVIDRVRNLGEILRLKAFDLSTEEGRSKERYRRAALTTITSVLGRVVTVFTSLLTVRLTIHYLGTERYGLWMSVTSVVAFLTFADMGIGNGLLNAIAEARGQDDVAAVHRYVSSAFFVLLAIATAFLGGFLCVYPFIPWPRFFNVYSPVAMRESGPAVIVFLSCFLANIPLDVVQRVQTGHQEGYTTNFWMIIGNLTGLGALLFVMHERGGLPWLILAILGGQILGVLGNWVQEFGFSRTELFPDWHFWDKTAARKIVNTGIMFFLLQVCGAFTLPLDLIIITQILGPDAVTQYSVPIRLFVLVATVANMFVLPLWPAYGEAFSRGDHQWVKTTLYHSLSYSVMAFGPVIAILAVFGKFIVRIWVGTQVHPSWLMLFGMAIYAICLVIYNPMSTFLSGINRMKVQVIVGLTQAIIAAALKIVMAKASGLTGVVWASAVMTFAGTAAVFFYVRGLLGRMAEPAAK